MRHACACCDQASATFPAAKILVEKPTATTLTGARHVISDIGASQPVDIAYHMAFSPEVDWGATITTDRAADLGDPTAITCTFTDPYAHDATLATARFRTSGSTPTRSPTRRSSTTTPSAAPRRC